MSAAAHGTVDEGRVFTGEVLAALERKFAEYLHMQPLLVV